MDLSKVSTSIVLGEYESALESKDPVRAYMIWEVLDSREGNFDMTPLEVADFDDLQNKYDVSVSYWTEDAEVNPFGVADLEAQGVVFEAPYPEDKPELAELTWRPVGGGYAIDYESRGMLHDANEKTIWQTPAEEDAYRDAVDTDLVQAQERLNEKTIGGACIAIDSFESAEKELSDEIGLA